MLTKAKIRQSIYEIGVANAQAEDAALWTIETGTGNGDALVKVFDEMFEQGGGRPADIGIAHLSVELGMGNEGL